MYSVKLVVGKRTALKCEPLSKMDIHGKRDAEHLWSKRTIIQTNNAGNPLRRGFRRCLFFMIEIAKQRVLANFAWPEKNMEESFESGQIKDWELTIRQSWYIFILINDNVIDYLMELLCNIPIRRGANKRYEAAAFLACGVDNPNSGRYSAPDEKAAEGPLPHSIRMVCRSPCLLTIFAV